MTNIISVLSIIWLVFFQSHDKIQDVPRQNFFSFIKDYPIKIDGGSFYTYDTTALSKERYIFIIGKDKVGFVQKSKNFTLFHGIKRQITKNGYSDIYVSDNYKILLNVNKLKDIGNGRSEYGGTIILKSGKSEESIMVHGVVDEAIR